MRVLATNPLRFTGVAEFHADRLRADLDVQVQPGPITVTTTGPDADTIRAERRGTTAYVTGGPSWATGSVNIHGDGVSIQGATLGGDVYVNGVRITPGMHQRQRPRVTVTVPKGTPVTLNGVTGMAEVGSTHGNLAVVVTGSGRVTAGAVAALGCRVTGIGDVIVDYVEGEIIAEVAGSGDVQIGSGYAPSVRLQVAGSGDITCNATAERAALSCAGSGDVWLARSLTQPSRQQAGSGRIRVGRIGR